MTKRISTEKHELQIQNTNTVIFSHIKLLLCPQKNITHTESIWYSRTTRTIITNIIRQIFDNVTLLYIPRFSEREENAVLLPFTEGNVKEDTVEARSSFLSEAKNRRNCEMALSYEGGAVAIEDRGLLGVYTFCILSTDD